MIASRIITEHLVPAGSQAIETASGKMLVALLGSCVGVALSDRENGVGGIAHLLLPEPAVPESPWQPELYASTGLPLFIDRLLEAGATKDRMVAVVAGGSLTGPVSQMDLNLDIGGRTTEIVMKLLNERDIAVITSDTGGYYGSKLMLDTSTWETHIRPTIPVRARHRRKVPSREEIDRAIASARPIPQIALKIIRLLRQQDYELASLVREVSRDQVIAAKVLQLCNSALYGTGHIDSIDRALVLLGENHLLEIVLAFSVESYFSQEEGGYSLRQGGLYLHSLGVASAAKTIAAETGCAPPDTAYTAGLLHDIGKVVLDHFISASDPLFYQPELHKQKNFIDQERSLLGIDHQEAGLRLALNWNLADNLTAVIAHHFDPQQSRSHSGLVHAVYLANLLTSWFQAGMELEHLNAVRLGDSLAVLGLSPSALSNLIARVPWNALHAPS